MGDDFSPLAFVEEWRRKSAELSSETNDELSSVQTRALETIVAVLTPSSTYATVERRLASLQNDTLIAMQYDSGAHSGTRAITYGLVQSIHAAFTNMMPNRPVAAQEEEVHDDAMNISLNNNTFCRETRERQAARAAGFAIKVEQDDEEYGMEELEATLNMSMPFLNSLPANPRPAARINRIHRPFSQSDDEDEEEQVDVKPAVKRGRPKKMTVFEPKRLKKSGKDDIQKNTLDFKKYDLQKFKREAKAKKVKKEVQDDKKIVEKEVDKNRRTSARSSARTPKSKKVQQQLGNNHIKNEPLDGFVEGTDCFVCSIRMKRSMRGYTDHIARAHRITLKNSGYQLLCECGATIECTGDARHHDKECFLHNYTAQRVAGDQ